MTDLWRKNEEPCILHAVSRCTKQDRGGSVGELSRVAGSIPCINFEIKPYDLILWYSKGWYAISLSTNLNFILHKKQRLNLTEIIRIFKDFPAILSTLSKVWKQWDNSSIVYAKMYHFSPLKWWIIQCLSRAAKFLPQETLVKWITPGFWVNVLTLRTSWYLVFELLIDNIH